MLSNRQNEPAAASGSAPTGLENHVRNLILSNSSSDSASSPRSLSAGRHSLPPGFSSSPASSQAPSSNCIDEKASPKASPQPPKAGRNKRPNQAQRRQMNSQFSIPIDPRPQQSPPVRSYQSPNSYHSRPSQPHQRHMHANSVPRDMHQDNRSNYSYGSNSWVPPSHHGPPPNFSPQHSQASHFDQRRGGAGQLYNPRRPQAFSSEDIATQATLLDQLSLQVVQNSEIELSEIKEKEAFRCRIEGIVRETITRYENDTNQSGPFDPFSVELKCFGSLASGFATKASDMDLGLLSPLSLTSPEAAGSSIPRLLEKAFLDTGLGARLLTRTRVPIIKLCQNPPKKLYQDLLDERFRWENGLDDEDHETHEDDQEHNRTPHEKDGEHGHTASTGDGSPSTTEFTVATESPGEPQRFDFKQGPKSSLSSYYGLGKRILRRAGGHDATMSNWRNFTDQDWDLLDRVCEAFIAGLADPELRERLSRFSPAASSNLPNKRTLLGVFTQAEGEQVIQLWLKRGVTERRTNQQAFMEQSTRMFRDLQTHGFGLDPVYHTKQLQMVLERLRKSPSVQFVTLEQGQHETPTQYFNRFWGIVENLEPESADPSLTWHETITKQYVAGVYQEDIRNAVQDCVDSWDEKLPMKAISRRHESLHLAWELERALEKDLYDDAHVTDIEKYIALLRSPLQRSDVGNEASAFSIPLDDETSALVKKIRAIPNPHKMAPNQPKDRYRDRLEFPKIGAGVQCDINFSAHLALQNTLLLRCYSHTDPRVRPMILFIKHWAKIRGINSGYRGTLSSYGYVLMVLHYLVNVAQPFVCPNLQQLAPQPPPYSPPDTMEARLASRGYNVQFWRNEQEILELAQANQLNRNTESLGHLLRGFFEYYAQIGHMSLSQIKGFDWGRDVLSLRSPGGLLTKQIKGWTGAKTVFEAQGSGGAIAPPPVQTVSLSAGLPVPNTAESAKQAPSASKTGEVKEIRHRYLFAIEDPFEVDHNVARTVTHNGIVSIRDEFRRAWRIIKAAGNGSFQEDLLRDVSDEEELAGPFLRLLDDIHGIEPVRGKQATVSA
ncbi:hypothetical protein B0T10DRAFT_47082 [Thelonectria olida]|uniref:polynucleotide adenylyltransferase n=1 Tax=Thelonectria olida TaxID=1576542 RepID=A0A9P8W411_9HYPO|nr:hypothetical protein B0T10DRAFT_47082 [Thelonectria olida]